MNEKENIQEKVKKETQKQTEARKEEKEILPDVINIKTQDTYTLPSKGLLYSETDRIPASITLRRMTTKEDKIRIRNSSEDKIRRDILQACILNENVDASKLKLMDANFLLFRLRALSLLKDTYKIQLNCNKCGSDFIHEINLLDVPIKYINDEVLTNLKIELPIGKWKIDLKYPSLADLITMGEKLKEYFDKFPDADKSEAVYTTSAMLYIDKVNNGNMLTEELEAWIDDLDIIDNRELRTAIIKLDDLYGFGTELKTKCPACGNILEHGLPITGELFNPSL